MGTSAVSGPLSESTNFHITERGKAFPHQAPLQIISENLGSRFLY